MNAPSLLLLALLLLLLLLAVRHMARDRRRRSSSGCNACRGKGFCPWRMEENKGSAPDEGPLPPSSLRDKASSGK